MTDAHRTERLQNGGWRYTEEAYNRRWFASLRARTVCAENGCWIWQGPVSSKGYIMKTHRDHKVQGHRIVYKLLHGVELKTEQFVCHTCDERRCWNPAHLYLGSAKSNNRDCGNKGRHHNGIKTHCKRGHEFTFENTYLKVTPTTVMRACKACSLIKTRLESGWTLEEAMKYPKIPSGYTRSGQPSGKS